MAVERSALYHGPPQYRHTQLYQGAEDCSFTNYCFQSPPSKMVSFAMSTFPAASLGLCLMDGSRLEYPPFAYILNCGQRRAAPGSAVLPLTFVRWTRSREVQMPTCHFLEGALINMRTQVRPHKGHENSSEANRTEHSQSAKSKPRVVQDRQ